MCLHSTTCNKTPKCAWAIIANRTRDCSLIPILPGFVFTSNTKFDLTNELKCQLKYIVVITEPLIIKYNNRYK